MPEANDATKLTIAATTRLALQICSVTKLTSPAVLLACTTAEVAGNVVCVGDAVDPGVPMCADMAVNVNLRGRWLRGSLHLIVNTSVESVASTRGCPYRGKVISNPLPASESNGIRSECITVATHEAQIGSGGFATTDSYCYDDECSVGHTVR